jgi:hypothetical protein
MEQLVAQNGGVEQEVTSMEVSDETKDKARKAVYTTGGALGGASLGAAGGTLGGSITGGVLGATAGYTGPQPGEAAKKAAKKAASGKGRIAKKGIETVMTRKGAAGVLGVAGAIAGGIGGLGLGTLYGGYKGGKAGYDKAEKMAKSAAEKKKTESYAEPAALAAGALVGGAGYIDTRKKTDLSTLKKLDPKKLKLQAGDVIIGAESPAENVTRRMATDVRKAAGSGRKSAGVSGAIKGGWDEFKSWGATVASKFGNPKHSHVETAISPRKSNYVGGGDPQTISSYTKPHKKRGNPEFVVLRRKDGPWNKQQIGVAKSYMNDSSKRYNQGGIIKAQIKDWLLPKFSRSEKDIAGITTKGQACTTKGVCSTAGSAISKRTVGGKGMNDVLPGDYLRSGDYEAVGFVGEGKTYNPKVKGLGKLYKATPHVVRGAAGLAAAGAAYGGAKLIAKARDAYKAKSNS